MRTPSSALPASPQGLDDGLGRPLATAFFAAGFFAFSVTTFFAAALALGLALVLGLAFVLALAFLPFAIVVPLRVRLMWPIILAKHALRVEVADAAALAAGCRIDHRVDESRLAGVHGLVHGAPQLVRCRHIDADAAERFHHLVVARVLDEHGGRNVRTAGRVDVGSAIDAVIVEDDDADRQVVAADRLDLHAGEAKGTVTFDREHAFAGLDCGRDGKAHADPHDPPGADVKTLARLIHVDDAAREIERVGSFIDEDGIRPLLDDGAQGAERAVVVHRRGVLHQPRRHLGDVLFSFRFDGADPVSRRRRPFAVDAFEQSRYTGADVADHWSDDLDIAVHLLGLDVDLDELLRVRFAPGLAFAVRQQPVQARADQHHDVGVFQHRRTRRARTQRMRVGQQAFAHAHRQERNAAFFDQGEDRVIGLRVGRALAEDDQRTLGTFQDIERALDGGRRRNLSRRRVDDLDQRLCAGIRTHDL